MPDTAFAPAANSPRKSWLRPRFFETVSLRTARGCIRRLLQCLMVFWCFGGAAPSLFADQAGDFAYTSNGSGITITVYTGTGGAVTIPDTIAGLPVRKIGDGAFLYLWTVRSVTIPDSVTTIGEKAFHLCNRMTSVSMGQGVTSIGIQAFASCASLASVTIPDSVNSIGLQAFGGCIALSSLIIGSGVVTIGDYAFSQCASLTGVALPDSVISVGEKAFYSCRSLESISLGKAVRALGSDTFFECAALRRIEVAAGNTVYRSVDGVLFDITQKRLIRFPAAKAGDYVIPAVVITVDPFAFTFSTGLTSVTIPDGVTSLGPGAFSFCPVLENIEVGAGNTVYLSVNGVLCNTGRTVLMQYPTGRAGGYIIPDSITFIQGSAFEGSSKLSSVGIPSSVTGMGAQVFSYCAGLTSIAIPASLAYVPNRAFYSCPGLISVFLPDTFTGIGHEAFRECNALTTVTAGKSLISIGKAAFFNCISLASFTIGDNVTSIGEWAFWNCGLTSLTIGKGVTSINERTFLGCRSLTSVTIPANVRYISYAAFYSCARLTNVTFEGNAPASFGSQVFSNTGAGFAIHYYEGSTGFTSPTWNGYPSVAMPRPGPTVKPVITYLSRSAGAFSVIVAGQAGLTYELQRKLDLRDAGWQRVTATGPLATDQSRELTDPQPPADRAFYRVFRTGP